jgi:4-methyl-5(b-hydroxyethyl)-thiazole monophosphate biosynthesis
VTPDDTIEAIVLPGGMPGADNLEKNPEVQAMIDFAAMKNVLIAAICAAPMILGHKRLLEGRKATCFPGFEKELFGAHLSDKSVCTDGNIVTAKGMGASIDFSVEILRILTNKQAALKLKESLQCP